MLGCHSPAGDDERLHAPCCPQSPSYPVVVGTHWLFLRRRGCFVGCAFAEPHSCSALPCIKFCRQNTTEPANPHAPPSAPQRAWRSPRVCRPSPCRLTPRASSPSGWSRWGLHLQACFCCKCKLRCEQACAAGLIALTMPQAPYPCTSARQMRPRTSRVHVRPACSYPAPPTASCLPFTDPRRAAHAGGRRRLPLP